MKDEIKSDRAIPALRDRTHDFAVRIVRMYSALPVAVEAQTIGKQAFRSGTSVDAHYREACRAKSDADFVSKIEGALPEPDETAYWLGRLVSCEVVKRKRMEPLLQETNELTAILVTSSRKVKAKRVK
jgi:four helix bundle protein